MSTESCADFLRNADTDPEVQQQMKAVTSVAEVIRLGRTHGYLFDRRDLVKASSASAVTPEPERARPAGGHTGCYHHEYVLDELPGFAAVADELPRLKIKPATVDLARFDELFREDDLRSTDLSPSTPEYERWRYGLPDPATWKARPDFHLINLDEHIAHPEYEEYFVAKMRVVAALEKVFDSEIRFSGSMWYPPSSYRLWHTNEDQPGWRMYVIDVDEEFADPEHTSFFRYQHPETGELVTLRERPRMVRFFKVEQEPDRLFWHCIVNPTERHRWSFGFAVPDTWIDSLPVRP
jgi:predicted ribosomally synthesized peptide with nif11-like leader